MSNTKSKKIAVNKITTAYNAMREALTFYQEGIDHFYKYINFGASHLDAAAIVFMNDSNIKISNALKLVASAPTIIESK